MNPIFKRLERHIALALTASIMSIAGLPTAAAAEAILISGVQVDYGDELNREYRGMDMAGMQSSLSLQDLCDASHSMGPPLRSLLGMAMGQAGSGVPMVPGLGSASLSSLPGLPSQAEIERDLGQALNEVCNDDPQQATALPYTITYSQCRMKMDTPANSMEIYLPPGLSEGLMAMANHGTKEATTLALRRNLEEVSKYVGKGWGNDIAMTAIASGEHIGYQTTAYTFEYKVGLGESGLGAFSEEDVAAGGITSMQNLGNMVSVTNSGTAWISSAVPGYEIVQAFYANLSSAVQPEGGAFSGLINSLVVMLQHGIPLEIEQKVESKLLGKTIISGRSYAVVSQVQRVPLHGEWCSQDMLPADYTITDIDQQISEAMSGATSGASGASQSGAAGSPSPEDMQQLNQAMGELNRAMEQMPPEQREAMQGLGLGSLFGGEAAANPADQPATRSMPSSAELYSDNLTQMVQRHLQALGYDPGNTDGTGSVETTIAISQFQAEKGMDVTGEVSPQLAGVLSAEVDRAGGN